MTLDYGAWASGGIVPPRRDDWLGPFRLGPNDGAANGIYEGDARQLARHIPDESVDLIFTDPVYQNIDDYRWLAETAARVLKPDGACLVFCGIGFLPETLNSLKVGGLNYRWRFIIRPVTMREFSGRLNIITQECVWFEKGKSELYASLMDLQFSPYRINSTFYSNNSNWGKGIDVIQRFISALSKSKALVFDPFTGGGTVPAVCKQLGRPYVAFEWNAATCRTARQRVRDTQPPLFVLEPEQLALPEAA